MRRLGLALVALNEETDLEALLSAGRLLSKRRPARDRADRSRLGQ